MTKKNKKTCHVVVVTGTRAEFGLLKPVMQAVAQHQKLRLSVVVVGMHWVTGTWREVTNAGFPIAGRVLMQTPGKVGRAADVAALGRGVTGLGKIFARLDPTLVMVLGDRIEALAAALAAGVGGYRLAHIHGGDRAEGVADEAMRHAISKLAHLHFPATKKSRQRLIAMGEDPANVYDVGSPAIDGIKKIKPLNNGPQIVVVQHPIGADDAQEKQWMKQTLHAVQAMNCCYLAPNGDPGSKGIHLALQQAKVPVIQHLPRDRFASMLAGAKVLVGNSSAGLIEAAALKVPCVNIGPRQGGRERANNVLDCDYNTKEIAAAIKKALTINRSKIKHPYGDGNTGKRIAQILARYNWRQLTVRKQNTY